MAAKEIAKGIYWVGAIDWDIRNFHGYLTQLGTTYNAYLVVDEKTVLVDTVKENMFDQMLYRIGQIVDPAKIDCIVSNHTELDHSGAIAKMKRVAPQAKLLCSTQGEKGLRRHFKKDWEFQVVKTGDTLDLGKRTLSFVNTPMVHWPDSMVAYVPEEKLLFSNDAFGQHLATPERFDDEIGWGLLRKEAAKYYANIVLPFGKQVNKALGNLSGLDIKTICPSHGVVWRKHISEILSEYQKWANNETENTALIAYDSMWGSTEKMARKLEIGLSNAGIPTTVRNLKVNDISDMMTDLLTSRMILLGSPTLNNGMLPTMGQFLTYLKGLKPQNRIGFAFGSYGWGGQAVGEIEKTIEEFKWDKPEESVKIEYIPDDDELEAVVKTGEKLGAYLQKSTS